MERLKEKTNNLLKDADNLYKTALIKLPMAVRKMNWIEYCSEDAMLSVVPHVSNMISFLFYFEQIVNVVFRLWSCMQKQAKKPGKYHKKKNIT